MAGRQIGLKSSVARSDSTRHHASGTAEKEKQRQQDNCASGGTAHLVHANIGRL